MECLSSRLRKVLETYGRQDVHYHTLWIAVVCNKIRDTDCVSTYIEIVYPDLKPGLLPKLALIFTPNSTEKEIIKTFKTERDSIIQKYLLYEVGKGE